MCQLNRWKQKLDGEDCGGSEPDRDVDSIVVYNQLIMSRLQTIPNMNLMTVMIER